MLLPSQLPLHLGALHPYEQALTLVLAFGPFVLLGLVVAVRRRADRALDEPGEGQPADDRSAPARPSSGQPRR